MLEKIHTTSFIWCW